MSMRRYFGYILGYGLGVKKLVDVQTICLTGDIVPEKADDVFYNYPKHWVDLFGEEVVCSQLMDGTVVMAHRNTADLVPYMKPVNRNIMGGSRKNDSLADTDQHSHEYANFPVQFSIFFRH